MGYKVIRDAREKIDHGWFWDVSASCDGTTVAKLDQGDYSLEDYEQLVVIERKGSVSEWATNVTQARFERELERLRSIKYVWILLEFDMLDILNYPVGSGIPKKVWKSIKLRGPFIIKRMIEIERDYSNINITLCGEQGKMIASSVFKRIIEKIEINAKN